VTDAPARKAALRRQVLARRDAIDPEERIRLSDEIFARVAALEWLAAARVVLAYNAYGSEPATAPFLRALTAQGKILGLPRVNRAARELELFRVTALDTDLEAGTWGILEPAPARCAPLPADEVDFVLVPGVAFDVRGGRIGHGAGYYDRLLARMAPGTRLVAAAFEVQVLDEVPMERHDRRLDLVVTERRLLPPSRLPDPG
jgi:5-formyltetrahydrofolate cyclo-ligase